MSENITRGKGKSQGYKFDRGGVSVETGPYIGEIRNNIDPLRLGRVSVYIEEFAGPDKDDPALWRTVRYISPFFGTTEKTGNAEGVGSYEGNQHSYGMWFTPPDIGTRVMCFFPAGRHNDGYYFGCIPEPGINHMVPAIAGSDRVDISDDQQDLFAGATRLPVTEINNEDPAILQDPAFFNQPKPVHSVVAKQLFEQGLLQDRVRGTIGSSSQRETPSSVYGVSTPGRPVFQTRLDDDQIREKLRTGEITPDEAKVVARRGGHSFVMDDGDLDGRDQAVRIRTSRGHQITMSDSGDCFYITHANGKSWLEFGKEGTVDVYSTNSINLRTEGDLNLHADQNVNINAGQFLNLNAEENMTAQSTKSIKLSAQDAIGISGDKSVGIRSTVNLAIQSTGIASLSAGGILSLRGSVVGLNTFPPTPVLKPAPVVKYPLPESRYDPSTGWKIEQGEFETIATRAPTHEPYPHHNLGVALETRLTTKSPSVLSRAQQAAIDSVQNQQVNGISVADIALQSPAQISLGPLDPLQVTSLMAQTAKEVGQGAEEISEKGLGKFGLTLDKLEEIGALKPGSTQLFSNSASDLTEFVKNPQIWSGKDGVTNVETLLASTNIQDTIQQQVMSKRFLQLQDSGLITGEEAPEQLASFVQTAAKSGIGNTKRWIESFTPIDGISDTIGGITGGITGGIGDSIGGIADGDTIGDTIGGITGGIGDSIGGITGGIGDSIGGITGGIGDSIGGIGDSIGGITDNIGDTIGGITDNIGDTISNFKEGISGGDFASSLGDINLSAAGAQYALKFVANKFPALGSFFGGGGGTGTRVPFVGSDTADIPEAFADAASRIVNNPKVQPFITPDDGSSE